MDPQNAEASGVERRAENAADRGTPIFYNEAILSREIQVIIARVKNALPFMGLILAKYLLQNGMKFIFYIGSAMVLFRINNGFNEQVSLKSKCNNRILCGLFLVSLSLICSILFSMSVFGDDRLWLRLVLLHKDEPNLGITDILWLACVTDLVSRTVLTALKIIACLTVPSSSICRTNTEYVSFFSTLVTDGEFI